MTRSKINADEPAQGTHTQTHTDTKTSLKTREIYQSCPRVVDTFFSGIFSLSKVPKRTAPLIRNEWCGLSPNPWETRWRPTWTNKLVRVLPNKNVSWLVGAPADVAYSPYFPRHRANILKWINLVRPHTRTAVRPGDARDKGGDKQMNGYANIENTRSQDTTGVKGAFSETAKTSRLEILVYSHGAFVIQVEAENRQKPSFVFRWGMILEALPCEWGPAQL